VRCAAQLLSAWPAALNARSLAALEAGTPRILRVKIANLEYEQQCEIEVIYSA